MMRLKQYRHKWIHYRLDVAENGHAVLWRYTRIYKRRLWSIDGPLESVLNEARVKFEDFVECPDE